jgi:hypothetical protein
MFRGGQIGHGGTLGGTAAVLALLGGVAMGSAGCGDDDDPTRPSSGGSGGTAGRGGSGGSSGSAGSGGANGGSGGNTGGSAGSGGAAGAGGANGGSGGAGGAPNYQAIAAALCERYDEVSAGSPDGDAGAPDASTDAGLLACEPASTCVEDNVSTFTFVETTFPDCIDEAQTFFTCLTTAPANAFECSEGTPQYATGTPPCDDEEAALNGGFADPTTCAD